MVKQDIYISHVVGRCAICGFYIIDTGYSDEMDHEFLFNELSLYGRNDWFFNAFHGSWEII